MNKFKSNVLKGSLLGLLIVLFFMAFKAPLTVTKEFAFSGGNQKDALIGGWRMVSTGATGGNPEMTVIMIVTDTYYTTTSFDKNKREFAGTYGGTYSIDDKFITERIEYFTWDSTKVGTANTFNYSVQNGKLEFFGERGGEPFKETWEKIDGFSPDSKPLAGVWRIRERQREPGSMSIMEWGPRKTLKILSDNRFQWIAFNVETKQFSGTGGGTYTAENGKYTETLEFFSRDPNRVGAQLSFEFEVKDNRWHHKGKSSAGDDIYEIWENVD